MHNTWASRKKSVSKVIFGINTDFDLASWARWRLISSCVNLNQSSPCLAFDPFPPSKDLQKEEKDTNAAVMWSFFAQNRRQLSTIIVGKLLARICNYWPLIVIKFTTNARRLTPFDKKLASMSFYFRKVLRSLERHLFHVQKTTFSGYMFLHLVKFFWNHFQSIKLFVNNGGDPHYKRRTLCSNKNWLMTALMGCFAALFDQSIHFTVK